MCKTLPMPNKLLSIMYILTITNLFIALVFVLILFKLKAFLFNIYKHFDSVNFISEDKAIVNSDKVVFYSDTHNHNIDGRVNFDTGNDFKASKHKSKIRSPITYFHSAREPYTAEEAYFEEEAAELARARADLVRYMPEVADIMDKSAQD